MSFLPQLVDVQQYKAFEVTFFQFVNLSNNESFLVKCGLKSLEPLNYITGCWSAKEGRYILLPGGSCTFDGRASQKENGGSGRES